MPDEQNKLYLYEALELRAEYEGRGKTLKDCLPETKQSSRAPRLLPQPIYSEVATPIPIRR